MKAVLLDRFCYVEVEAELIYFCCIRLGSEEMDLARISAGMVLIRKLIQEEKK